MSLFGLNLGISAPFIGSLWAELFNLDSLEFGDTFFKQVILINMLSFMF